MDPSVIGNDLAYPAMLTFLPHGLLGLVLASLIAAYMSTISSHLNWGASYVVNDFYRRFLDPQARKSIWCWPAGLTTVLLILAAPLPCPCRTRFRPLILLTIGAGTGLLFLLRWFWWRINAWSEISAMVISFGVALYFSFADLPGWSDWQRLLAGVALTTLGWLAVTLLTPPADQATLRGFVCLVRPGGRGWKKVESDALADGDDLLAGQAPDRLPGALLNVLLASVAVYSALFAIGYGLYGNLVLCLALTALALTGAILVAHHWRHGIDQVGT